MMDWSADFSYEYYIKLLEVLKDNFRIVPISVAERAANYPSEKPLCFLRHDVDISIEKAVQMATIEHEMYVQSIYYIRTNTDLYSLNGGNILFLNAIRKMGHEIGLHYYPPQDKDIISACRKLEDAIKKPIRTISFHMPKTEHLTMGLNVSGLINTYAPELRKWYMSDSSGRWRDGEPLPQLLNPNGNLLQIVTHPIWWGKITIGTEWKDGIVRKLQGGM